MNCLWDIFCGVDYKRKKRVLESRLKLYKGLLKRVDSQSMNRSRLKKEKQEKQAQQRKSDDAPSTMEIARSETRVAIKDAVVDQVTNEIFELIDLTEFIPFLGQLKLFLAAVMTIYYFICGFVEMFLMFETCPYMCITGIMSCICCQGCEGSCACCFICGHISNVCVMLVVNIGIVLCYTISPFGGLGAMFLAKSAMCLYGSSVRPSTLLGTTVLVPIPHSSTLPRCVLCWYSSSYNRNIRRLERKIKVCDEKIGEKKTREMELRNVEGSSI
jgi:hypothetical protein